MDSIIGVVGKDFVLMASDLTQARSIMVQKSDEDKIVQIDDSKMFAVAGEYGDRDNFVSYITRNLKLFNLRTDLALSTKAVASFTQDEMASALRRNPYNANLLLGGYDEDDGAELYMIDYLGSCVKAPFAAHGYCSNFCLSIFDRHYSPDLTFDDAVELIRLCIRELNTRFLISQPKWVLKKLDANGITNVPMPVAQE
eukprot:TRINITY_DN9377_c0_g1_i2.p1 TRINITY_DN9377_c0_g1~~TRINITY_DN9377_c0_g1_i2.p1  ORF type:complete len:198 (-),score=47.52 TRINITY_DN9377_c0_g1_i2:62-655(-)